MPRPTVTKAAENPVRNEQGWTPEEQARLEEWRKRKFPGVDPKTGEPYPAEKPDTPFVEEVENRLTSLPLPQGEGRVDPSLLPPKDALEEAKAIVVEEPEAKPDLSKRRDFAKWLDMTFKAAGSEVRTNKKLRDKKLDEAYLLGENLGLDKVKVDLYLNK
jgi:hypothetical protein